MIIYSLNGKRITTVSLTHNINTYELWISKKSNQLPL